MRKSDNRNTATTPHFDGKKESIINDPTATQGAQMGIQVETTKSFVQEQDPFHLSKTSTNENMKEFEKLMRGNEVGK
jgi:hypothetical protein